MVLGIYFVVVFVLFVSALLGWSAHVAEKNIKIESLRQNIKDRDAAIVVANQRIQKLNSERVPLRTKCWCKHDAVAHDDNGCRIEYPFRWACACQISRDEVYYTPEPMRKMLPLGES